MRASTLRSAVLSLAPALFVCAPFVLATQDDQDPAAPVLKDAVVSEGLGVQFLEIVTPDRDATCKMLENIHGVAFGEPRAMLGNARTTALSGGGTLSVREPMHADEYPVVRPYFLVADIDAAVEEAAASAGEIAMASTPTIEDSRFAIFFHGGIQYGLWKK